MLFIIIDGSRGLFYIDGIVRVFLGKTSGVIRL